MNQQEDKELCENSEVIVKYIHKYIQENDSCYDKLLQIKYNPKLENEFTDHQWAMIIHQAWQLAYRKAYEDGEVSLEERYELNNIYALYTRYHNAPRNRVVLNHKLLNNFRTMHAIDNKEDVVERKWQPPKPTPWDVDWNQR